MSTEIYSRRLLVVLSLAVVVLSLLIIFLLTGNRFGAAPAAPAAGQTPPHMSYHANIVQETQANDNFRRVLFTSKTQLVVMSIPVGGEVGRETHKYTEQTLFFLSGVGQGELDGKQFPIVAGDVVVVPAGTDHNFWNTGQEPMKIYTVYSPPNHLDGLIEATKAEADANTADEAVGEKPPVQ